MSQLRTPCPHGVCQGWDKRSILGPVSGSLSELHQSSLPLR